jgi:hypothetical protein
MSPRSGKWLCVALLVSATPLAALETRCVDTVGELDAAVRIAIDDDVEIHLVRGTYDIAGTILNWFAFEEPEPDDDIASACSTASATRCCTIAYTRTRRSASTSVSPA